MKNGNVNSLQNRALGLQYSEGLLTGIIQVAMEDYELA
jgi:hypothetical protein